MRTLLLLLLLCSAAGSSAQTISNPQYQLTGKNYASEASAIQQMFYNVAGAIQKIVSSPLFLQNLTIAQLQGVPISKKGTVYYCMNCSPPKIVVSTGTAAGNFADAVGGTFK